MKVSGAESGEHVADRRRDHAFISLKGFIKSCCKSQFPCKSVNVFFILIMMKDKLTDLWGTWLLQNDLINTSCELSFCRAQCPEQEQIGSAAVERGGNNLKGFCLKAKARAWL